MSASASRLTVQCELEFQVASAQTGRNVCTTVCKRTMLIKRRGGLEVASEDPPLRKALKMQELKYEVYSSHLTQGKLTFITRDSGCIYQYNLRGGDPAALESILQFSIRMGAISKTPRARQLVVAKPPQQYQPVYTATSSLLGKRSVAERSARGFESPVRGVRRRTNEYESPSIDPRRRSAVPMPFASPETPARSGRKIRRTLIQDEGSVSKATTQERLTSEQRQIISLLAAKKSVFFTGCAGTGKSFLLQHILKIGRQDKRRVYATATTGIAAYNIGGMTLHHFAGLDARPNLGRGDLLRQIQQKKDALMRWRDVEVLVIDEISMLDGRLFDDLEALARQLRRDTRFFGGIQLVLSGDFFQLPPVSRDRNDVTLCFESAAWRRGVRDIVVLKEVFRQTNQEFVDILNAFRVGQPTDKMVATLNERYSSSAGLDWSAIHIFTHNNDVLQTNTKRLEELGGKKYNFVSSDTGKREYLSSCPAPPTISLKKDAHVMLTKTINPSSGLVNGSRGVVQGFTPQTNLPIVRFSNGATEIIQHEEFPVHVADTVLASRRQLPLTLAWAISIHKSQGLAFDSAVLDLSRVFEFGQAYVALSRVRSLEGLRLRSRLRTSNLLLADSKVLDFYQGIEIEDNDDK
ncbi:hypothetical protein Gpo141_00001118 [Globisporangium polare]